MKRAYNILYLPLNVAISIIMITLYVIFILDELTLKILTERLMLNAERITRCFLFKKKKLIFLHATEDIKSTENYSEYNKQVSAKLLISV